MPDKMNQDLLNCVERMFEISLIDIKKIIAEFHSEMKNGLAGKKSSLKMIPAFVDKPSGRETGRFIALDLGGTNFRILELELKAKGRIRKVREEKFVLQTKYIKGRGEDLFDFIAGCIKKFSRNDNFALGFTFSFPVLQTGIAAGFLMHWTKDFTAKGVEGKNVVELLNKSLKNKGVNNIKIAALANDTVGTLVARSYKDSNCDIGVILGTGTNASYREKTAKIIKWLAPKALSEHMIINIEWGNFNKLKSTLYDGILDNSSDNPGFQALEKMVSGMYLGEISRLVISDFAKESAFSGVRRHSIFVKKYAFKTEYMSLIENNQFEKLGIRKLSSKEKLLIKKICQIVSRRSARISAAALGAVITKIDHNLTYKHTVAMDGALYQKHPTFSKNIKIALKELFGLKAKRIRIKQTPDGSGIGAAIIASVAQNQGWFSRQQRSVF